MLNRQVRRLVGTVAFAMPVLLVIVGLRLDKSSLQYNPTYVKLIPVLLWSSMILAAVVPAGLIMTSSLSLPRRMGLTAAVWCLLGLECGLTFYIALFMGMR